MWQVGQKLVAVTCLWGLVFSLWGEPVSICFTAVEVEQIRQELTNMKLSVSMLKESQKKSLLESQTLQIQLGELEKKLQTALMELEKSASQLIQSQQKISEWQMLLQNLKLEYNELSKYCNRLNKENVLWKATAGVLAILATGTTLWALFK